MILLTTYWAFKKYSSTELRPHFTGEKTGTCICLIALPNQSHIVAIEHKLWSVVLQTPCSFKFYSIVYYKQNKYVVK